MNLRKYLKFRPDLLGTLFCMLACLCVALYLAAAESRSRYEAVMSGRALAARAVVDSRLERAVAAVTVLSMDPALDSLEQPGELPSRVRLLTETVGSRVVILPPDDTKPAVFDSRYPDGVPEHVRNVHPLLQALFTAHKECLVDDKYVVSDLHFSPRMNQHTAIVLVPIVRRDRLIGAIGMLLYEDRLADLVRPTDVPDGQFAALVDGANKIVDRSRGQRGERVGWPIPQWMADAMAQKHHGVMHGIGMSGVDNIMAYEHLTVAPSWHVIVGEPSATAYRFLWTPFLWIAFGGVCALTALAWWILAWRQRFMRDTDLLRTQKDLLSRLTRTMPAVQFLCDVQPDGKLRFSFIGGDFARVTGRNWVDASTVSQWGRLRAPDARPMPEVFQAALRDGRAVTEFRISQADGSWRWLRGELTRTQTRPDGSGEIVGYLVNIDDIRKAEQHAASAVHLSSVGKITSSLASHLRRPLAAAHIAAEILEYELASDDTTLAEERTALIKEKIRYVISAHDQLQRFARDRGYAMSLQDAAIGDILTRVQEAVATILHDDQITLAVNMPPPGCPRVTVNPVDLEQVLTCIILNARDAILAKGRGTFRHVRVDVIPAPAARTVSIKISDNGGGIPAEIMSRLFEPFVTTKKDAGNIGLDLTICSALMARMNGTLDAQNGDDGAIFTIVLPTSNDKPDTRSAPAN